VGRFGVEVVREDVVDFRGLHQEFVAAAGRRSREDFLFFRVHNDDHDLCVAPLADDAVVGLDEVAVGRRGLHFKRDVATGLILQLQDGLRRLAGDAVVDFDHGREQRRHDEPALVAQAPLVVLADGVSLPLRLRAAHGLHLDLQHRGGRDPADVVRRLN